MRCLYWQGEEKENKAIDSWQLTSRYFTGKIHSQILLLRSVEIAHMENEANKTYHDKRSERWIAVQWFITSGGLYDYVKFDLHLNFDTAPREDEKKKEIKNIFYFVCVRWRRFFPADVECARSARVFIVFETQLLSSKDRISDQRNKSVLRRKKKCLPVSE